MIPLAIGMVWVGYGVATYGWVLGNGWNITAAQWFSPLNPYQWPAGGKAPPKIPLGQMWPGKGPSSGTTTAGVDQAVA